MKRINDVALKSYQYRPVNKVAQTCLFAYGFWALFYDISNRAFEGKGVRSHAQALAHPCNFRGEQHIACFDYFEAARIFAAPSVGCYDEFNVHCLLFSQLLTLNPFRHDCSQLCTGDGARYIRGNIAFKLVFQGSHSTTSLGGFMRDS